MRCCWATSPLFCAAHCAQIAKLNEEKQQVEERCEELEELARKRDEENRALRRENEALRRGEAGEAPPVVSACLFAYLTWLELFSRCS